MAIAPLDYLNPADLDFSTASVADAAQALVDKFLVNDTTSTLTPTVTGTGQGPDYLAPTDADLSGAVALSTLLTAMETGGYLNDTGNPAASNVVAADYVHRQDLDFSTATLSGFLVAMEALGIFHDTQ